jgi:two-component system, sensor histidine kinase and response regulator
VPAHLVGDSLRLNQILTNLAGNALKFTERGHILVAVRSEARHADAVRLHFSVTDTGIGIPVDKQRTIFDAFSQADGSTTRRFGGTGLGLAISATLVRMMGGTIWVESEPGAGSTFHFTVALDIAATAGAAVPVRSLAEMRVLIVDDNPVNRRVLHAQATSWGMRPVVASNGDEALALLTAAAQEHQAFPLVLLDANMPDLDGFGVARAIADRPELTGATIMMLSSSGLAGEMTRCRELGIAAHLTKPINNSDLRSAICRVLERSTIATAAQPPGAPEASLLPAARAQNLPVAPDVRVLRVLVAEDNRVNQRVAQGLLTRRGHQVSIVGDGRQAVEAVENGTFDLVLMDVQMPEMDGIEATKAIRASEARTGRHVRIVAMTAHAMSGDRDRCFAAGMDGYLSKPIDPVMLRTVVESDPVSAPPPATVQPIGTGRALPIDPQQFMMRLGGDEQLFLHVVELFLQDCPGWLAAIKEAVDRRDADGIRSTAHALKGASANLSAFGLFDAAAVLERIGAEGRIDAAEAGWRCVSAEAAHVMDVLHQCELSGSSGPLLAL